MRHDLEQPIQIVIANIRAETRELFADQQQAGERNEEFSRIHGPEALQHLLLNQTDRERSQAAA